MNIDSNILQILGIVLVALVVFFIIKLIFSVIRSRRIEAFAIKQNNGKLNLEYYFFKIIHQLSDVLKKMVIFNTVAHVYDKYLSSDDKNFRTGLDFITLKIFSGLLLIFLYILGAVLYLKKIDSFIILLSFVIGFSLVDLVLVFKYDKRRRVIVNDILRAVIIMSNSFKANKSMDQALNEVVLRLNGPIKDEFNKVINDIKLGISVHEAFFRMYRRTLLNVVFEVANILKMTDGTGADYVSIFDLIEKKIVDNENVQKELDDIKVFNNIFIVFMIVLPIFMVFVLICLNIDYYNLILGKNGFMVIVLLLVVYVAYLFIIRKINRRDFNGR